MPEWTEQQKQAIYSKEPGIIVSAAAGSSRERDKASAVSAAVILWYVCVMRDSFFAFSRKSCIVNSIVAHARKQVKRNLRKAAVTGK